MSTFEEQKQHQNSEKPTFSQKIKVFWLEYGEKIILIVGIILIALISFEAGFLKGQKNQKDPVIISQAACAPCPKAEKSVNTNTTSNISQNTDSTAPNTDSQKCAFVASKNSNKYHLASCQFAQKIKAENRVCFSSKEEAESRGFQGAKCCIK